MDPLTIATTVYSFWWAKVTSSCLITGKALYDFSCKYRDVPRNILAISSEATVIGASLSQIQVILLSKENPEQLLRSRPEIATTLDTSLTGCMILFSCLDAEVRDVSKHARGLNRFSWVGKVKTIWKQEKFQELLDGIRGLQLAINTLIQLLQMDSLVAIKQLVKEKAPELKLAVKQTESLRRRHPSVTAKVAESIFSQEDRMSVYSLASSMVANSELEFDFDDIIVNSATYRRALAAAKHRAPASRSEEFAQDPTDLPDDTTMRERLANSLVEHELSYFERQNHVSEENQTLERKRGNCKKSVRELRGLIRDRHRLDLKLWQRHGVQKADREWVMRDGQKADEILQRIYSIVDSLEPNILEPEEWIIAQKIKENLGQRDQHAIWQRTPPWDLEEDVRARVH